MLLLLPENVERAASVEGIIVIAIIYAVLTVIGKVKEAASRGKEPPRPVAKQPEREPLRARRALPAPDTQSEAGRLEELLRGLGELAGMPEEGPMGRRSGRPLESAEEAEEREILETDQEPVRLEVRPARSKRIEVDQDEGAEALVQRRIQEVAARNRPLTQQDHLEFDKRLRAPEAKPAVVQRMGRQRLRDAIIWREILGPPLALRDINRPEA